MWPCSAQASFPDRLSARGTRTVLSERAISFSRMATRASVGSCWADAAEAVLEGEVETAPVVGFPFSRAAMRCSSEVSFSSSPGAPQPRHSKNAAKQAPIMCTPVLLGGRNGDFGKVTPSGILITGVCAITDDLNPNRFCGGEHMRSTISRPKLYSGNAETR